MRTTKACRQPAAPVAFNPPLRTTTSYLFQIRTLFLLNAFIYNIATVVSKAMTHPVKF